MVLPLHARVTRIGPHQTLGSRGRLRSSSRGFCPCWMRLIEWIRSSRSSQRPLSVVKTNLSAGILRPSDLKQRPPLLALSCQKNYFDHWWDWARRMRQDDGHREMMRWQRGNACATKLTGYVAMQPVGCPLLFSLWPPLVAMLAKQALTVQLRATGTSKTRKTDLINVFDV